MDNISPNTTDTAYGRIPLLWAAQGVHAGVIKLLLERPNLNLDIPAAAAKSPLG